MSWVAAAIAGSAVVGAVSANQQSKAAKGQSAPDLTAAQLAGIKADLATLPLRLKVSQAAQDGGVYVDPESGITYDFRGKFDPVRFFRAHPQALQQYNAENAENGEVRPPDSFAHDWLINNGEDEGAMQRYTTGSPEYKIETEAQQQAQRTAAGTDLAIKTAGTQLGALTGQPDFEAYVRNDPGLFAYWRDVASKESPEFADIAAWGKAHYEHSGKNEGRAVPTAGLVSKTNDLNLQTQNKTFDSALDASKKANAVNIENQNATHAAGLAANNLSFDANLAQSGKAARTSTDLQKEIMPQLNDLALKNQNAAFNQNLTQADTAAARAVAQQQANLPGLNDLSLRLQGDALTAGDAAGRKVNGGLYGIRDEYAANLLDEMKSGSELTPAQRNKVQQRIRGAQAARGNILGDGAAFDEAIAESDYAQNMINQRRSAALGLINSRDLNPNFSSVNVVNPTQVVAPNSRAFDNIVNPVQTVGVNNGPANFRSADPLSPNFTATTVGVPSLTPNVAPPGDPLAMLNPNAGPAGANAAMNVWGTNTNIAANQPNPWMQGAGLGLSAYSAYVNATSGNRPVTRTPAPRNNAADPCWVARVVLGTDDGRWLNFRAWLMLEAPPRFRARYLAHGERFAAWLHNKPGIRALLRPWFERQAAQMEVRA